MLSLLRTGGILGPVVGGEHLQGARAAGCASASASVSARAHSEYERHPALVDKEERRALAVGTAAVRHHQLAARRRAARRERRVGFG